VRAVWLNPPPRTGTAHRVDITVPLMCIDKIADWAGHSGSTGDQLSVILNEVMNMIWMWVFAIRHPDHGC